MCRSRTEQKPCSKGRLIATALAAAALGTALCGCSEMYFDHREGVTSGAGDAVAANEAMQTIDPWPARSGNPNIATNGQRMQSAVERYRTNNVTQPVDPMQIESANHCAADVSSHAAGIGAGPKHRDGCQHDNDHRRQHAAGASVAVITVTTRQI